MIAFISLGKTVQAMWLSMWSSSSSSVSKQCSWMNVDNNEQVKFGRNLGHGVKTRIGVVMWTHQTKNIAAAFSVSMSMNCVTVVVYCGDKNRKLSVMTLVGANTLHSSHAKLFFYLSLSYEFLRCMCKTFKCRQIEFWEKIKARKKLTL